jgi:ATP-binding cassette subfamily A (ABC1) protein 3
MEEAEALSTKMGIMVRGGIFKCYGSSQHIKSKFGTGFEIEIKIKKPTFNELKDLANRLGFVESFDDRVDIENAKLRA